MFRTSDLVVHKDCFRDWWLHAEGMVWPDMVVLAQPLTDDGLGLLGGGEPFGVQDLPAQGRIADPRRTAGSRHISPGSQLNLNLSQNRQAFLVRISLPSHAEPSHWHNDSGSVLGDKDTT
jgi:hypothetical protein